jgi:DNA (cytosine-5)-methyltransferase 1
MHKENLNELALFAGGGGGLLGGKLLGWRTVCYVEHDRYCVDVLKARIRDGYLDDGPIWDDVRTFDGRPWAGCVDVITAGFPCQPYSSAGDRLGERDERNLWPDTLRIIREVGPGWVLLENVSRLLTYAYVRRIFGDLAESGYDARWDCIPAAAVGAPHIRDRVWIVGHANQGRFEGYDRGRKSQEFADGREILADANRGGYQNLLAQSEAQKSEPEPGRSGGYVPDSLRNELEEQGNVDAFARFAKEDWWAVEPELGRVAHGVAHRVDRLRAIGNGQVPAVARAAWKLLA